MVNGCQFEISQEEHGQRLDQIVGRHLSEASRRELRELFAQGRVRAGGAIASKGDAGVVGTWVQVGATEPDASGESTPQIRVVFETDQVAVIDKPAGQPSTPLRGRPDLSLARALLERYPEMRGIGFREDEAGLLSRLDIDTSGLVVSARTVDAFRELREGAKRSLLLKEYKALVSPGCTLAPGTIALALGPRRGNSRKVATGADIRGNAFEATTELLAVEEHPVVSVVTLRVQNAYRHQVRAHLAFSGWPLLGDELYGGVRHPRLTRHALHAQRVAWLGSAGVPTFDVNLDLPPDLADLVSGD
jgi:23S rRNA pseudouridine1911/1915/1917 synthase